MFNIINAKDINGQLYELKVVGKHINEVKRQQNLLTPSRDEHQLDLKEFLDNWHIYAPKLASGNSLTIDAQQHLLISAGVDVHVHSRDPGLIHKEDWQSLSQAAHQGGVTAVVDMPNTIPAMLHADEIKQKAELAAQSDLKFKLLLGVSSKNIHEIKGLLSMPSSPLCGIKVFYGKSTGDLIFDDLELLQKSLPEKNQFIIVFHSEDQCCIDQNFSEYGDRIDSSKLEDFIIHSLIRSSKAAMTSTEAILNWAIRYKRPVHIAHISTPQEVEMILKANKCGAQISCEVAPHHLFLDTSFYAKLGSLVKMNPPVRNSVEVQQLNRHFSNGEIDIWATDHAPHTRSEKASSVRNAPSGVPSIELFYPLFFECLARNQVPIAKLYTMANLKPAKLFGFDKLGEIKSGNFADFVFMEECEYLVEESKLLGKSKWSPYQGFKLKYKVLASFNSGELKYSNIT